MTRTKISQGTSVNDVTALGEDVKEFVTSVYEPKLDDVCVRGVGGGHNFKTF